jgi:hypothetical protein
MQALLHDVWSDWKRKGAVGAGLAASAGLLSAFLTPRGPITVPQALVSMAAALLLVIAAVLQVAAVLLFVGLAWRRVRAKHGAN